MICKNPWENDLTSGAPGVSWDLGELTQRVDRFHGFHRSHRVHRFAPGDGFQFAQWTTNLWWRIGLTIGFTIGFTIHGDYWGYGLIFMVNYSMVWVIMELCSQLSIIPPGFVDSQRVGPGTAWAYSALKMGWNMGFTMAKEVAIIAKTKKYSSVVKPLSSWGLVD